jgi:hypothetical protein
MRHARLSALLCVSIFLSGARATAWAAEEEETNDAAHWVLITDDDEEIELERISNFLCTDASDTVMIVCSDSPQVRTTRHARIALRREDPESQGLQALTAPSLQCAVADRMLTLTGLTHDTELAIYTTEGRLLSLHKARGGVPFVLSVDELPCGIYFLHAECMTFPFLLY